MADIKHTFTGGKMNKDLDERLVRNGEYRDAMNIQVRTTDGDAAGAIQNIRGNIEVGVSYDETWMNALGIMSKNSFPTCIASVSDEKKDNAYFFFASPIFNTARHRITSYEEKIIYVDSILEHKVKSRITSPVVVDCYAVIQKAENLFTEFNQVGTVLGDSWNEIRVVDITNIRVGMTIKAYSYNEDTQLETELFTQNNGTTPVIKAISPQITFDESTGTTGYSILLNENVTTTNLATASHFLFESERVLKFDHKKSSGKFFHNITGINIIDNLLFWTDNKNEPKKINIDRCKAGSMAGSEVVESDFSNNTRLIIEDRVTSELTDVSEFDEYLEIDFVDNYLKEKHITVIRKAPTKALTVLMKSSVRPNSTVLVSNLSFVGEDYSPLGFNSEISFSHENLLDSSYRKDDILIFSQLDGNLNPVIDPLTIKAKFICYADENGDEILEPTTTIRFRLLFSNPEIGQQNLGWKIELEQKDPYFELKMARFAYRYKYEDGEYSSFSPWSRIAFLPGTFDYSSNKAYNLGMTNTVRELTLANFIPYNRPKDVIAVDILYKTTDSPSIYVVDTIIRDKSPEWDLFTPSTESDNIKTGQLTITSEMIHRILPESQLLRSWDNVPRKALSQEIVGNRLLYGNYVQGYDIKSSVGLIQSVVSEPAFLDNPKPSVKSIRDYKVGMVFGDKYGRETPVVTSGYSLETSDGNYNSLTGDITVEKTLAAMSNKFELLQDWSSPNNTSGEPTSWLKDGGYVKYYIKETSNEYYNLVMDRWYDAGDDTIWLSFNSADRNKVDEETYLILKNINGTNTPVLDKARYKIIAIENEAPDYIKNENLNLGEVRVYASNTGYSMWPNQSTPNDDGQNTVNIETDSDPIGLYSDDVSSDTNSPYSIEISASAWDNSPVGDSNSEQGVFGRKMDGRVQLRVVVRDSDYTNTQMELATSWKSLSHYSATGSDDDGNAEKVKFTWSKLFNSTGNGGGNLFTQATANALMLETDLQWYVQFREVVVSKKPEFDGRFFVKIHKDASIRQWIMNIFTGGNFTYEPIDAFEISYIDQQENNATSQNMASNSVVHKYTSTADVEQLINVSEYASATFGSTDTNSSSWFGGKWQGVTDYWVGDDVLSLDNSWVDNPTWHSGNRLEEWRDDIFGDDKPLFSFMPNGEPLSSNNTILEATSINSWEDSGTPCTNIIDVFGGSGGNVTFNENDGTVTGGYGAYGSRCYDLDRLRTGVSQSALWNGGWAGKDGTSLSYSESSHDFWRNYISKNNTIFLDGAWSSRYAIDSNYLHIKAMEDGYYAQLLGGYTNFSGGSNWDNGWSDFNSNVEVTSSMGIDDWIVTENQTSPIDQMKLSHYKSEVFTKGGVVVNGVTGGGIDTLTGNQTMGRMSVSTMMAEDGSPYNLQEWDRMMQVGNIIKFTNDPTGSMYQIVWTKQGAAWNYTLPSTPNRDYMGDQNWWSGWDAPVGKLSIYWTWIRSHYNSDLQGKLSINSWVKRTTSYDSDSLDDVIFMAWNFNPFTAAWDQHPQNYSSSGAGYETTSVLLGSVDEAELPVGYVNDEYNTWSDAYFQNSEPYDYPSNQYLITDPYYTNDSWSDGNFSSWMDIGSLVSGGSAGSFGGSSSQGWWMGFNEQVNISENDGGGTASYYGSPIDIPPIYTCVSCSHKGDNWIGIGGSTTSNPPDSNYTQIFNDYVSNFDGSGWNGIGEINSTNWGSNEAPAFSFEDTNTPVCRRYVAQVEIRRIDEATNSITTMGMDLEQFDPRAFLKHDGGTSIGIQLIDIFPVYEEEGNASFSELGACWETEPRDDVDLDIYYEASSAIPIVLDKENAIDFCPVYSTVSIERLTSGGVVQQPTLTSNNNNVFVDNVHFFNKSTIVELSSILPGTSTKELLKSGILLDDKICFLHPDGTKTKSQILSFCEPISDSTTDLYYTGEAFNSSEISGGITDGPRSFKRVEPETIEFTSAFSSQFNVNITSSANFINPGTLIQSITQGEVEITVPDSTYITQSIYASSNIYVTFFNNIDELIANGLNTGLNFTVSIISPTGYYEIDPDVWQYPVQLPWHNCYSFGNGVESDRIRDDFNAPQIDNGVKVSTTFSGYGEERIGSGLIYSGLYNSTSEVNDLNEFNMSQKITKDLNPSYGSIQRLKTRDTDVVVLTEDKVLKVLASKDALFNADGNPQLTASNRVLGTAVPFVGDYGISNNPESLAWDQYRMYFTDKQRGAVLRLSRDGLTPISNIGMKTWFRENLKNTNIILGTFDTVNGEYNVTNTYDSASDITVSFNEAAKGWVSFKSFIPTSGVSVSGKYITTNKNKIWEHHVSEYDEDGVTCSGDDLCVDRNNFYDTGSIDSSVEILFNDLPSVVKSFKTVDYEGSQAKVTQELEDNEYYNLIEKKGWRVSSINTDLQEGSLSEFIDKEGKWFNNINGLKTTVANLDTKEFTVQGIGTVVSVEEAVTEENDLLDTEVIEGCMDELAFNYSATANTDDGSCCYVGGCTQPQALNYNSNACFDDGSCIEQLYGCMDETATNYNENATNACWWSCCEYDEVVGVISNDNTTTIETPVTYGCMDVNACNYNALATVNQFSAADTTDPCEYTTCQGCTDPDAFNYNAGDDGLVLPCLDSEGVENGYGGGCCQAVITGCMDSTAGNYNPSANVDDGSCTYDQPATLIVQQDTVAPYSPFSVNTWNEDNSQGEIIEGENDWNEFINY
tara:strand:- start:4682 stop:12757 length:8076 start_codon:yes stop_codon:yes gene_type:complete